MKDSIKQIGRYIKENADKREIALKRVAPIIPITDRVRDLFDDKQPAEMVFRMPKDDTQVHLDLRFLPLPFNLDNTLCGECHCRTSEYYYGGETEYTTVQNFEDDTIRVYIDGIRTTNFAVTGVNTIDLLDTTTIENIISITYVYAIPSQCSEGTDTPNYEGNVFAGIIRTGTPFDNRSQLVYTGNYLPIPPNGDFPTVGPVHLNQTAFTSGATTINYYTSITVEEKMIVRLAAHVHWGAPIIPPALVEIQMFVNGTEIARTGYVSGGGFGELFIDKRNVQLQAGDTVSIVGTHPGIFWTNYGENHTTYLVVVRGTYHTVLGDWVGP